MQQNYPAHIYEQIRQEVAKSYIRDVLPNYFESVKDVGVWRAVSGDIDRWFDGGGGLYPVRDFWNGFYGILMGFKLLIHLIEFVTGENVIWTKEEIEIEKLDFIDLGKNIPKHLGNEPVIVTQKQVDGIDKLVVYDGNNRVTQARNLGKTKITAFVGRFVDERRRPKNYWLPTPIIYEVYTRVKKARDNEELYGAYVKVLADMLSDSQSGKYEFSNRVPGREDEFKKKLMMDLGMSDTVTTCQEFSSSRGRPESQPTS